ncbi:hypothetical protein H696_02660 [Fonticula alba]|uniref:J domain-containing protein n=1 Tax=Fonticula alba TaxID=691883 RepID=A0A058Z8S6_FONAL|nr:hypothetical protein H696_02660 [Fonticula alba]KCV70333.1 hypothetical protein H696_02660 [Fonticula alba]|eukprot:XP_009494849.1 hypothetical protein H696_02660 [Fonticula alba]
MRHNALTYVGVDLKVFADRSANGQPVRREDFILTRFGPFSDDNSITSIAEFRVHKLSPRHGKFGVSRILCFSERCIIERDPGYYALVTVRPLSEVFALVRSETEPQQFAIEYKSGAIRWYTSTERDSLLASLLDGVRASGNRDVCIKMRETSRSERIGLWSQPVDEEIQLTCLTMVAQFGPNSLPFEQLISRFNANVDYSGLHLHDILDSKEVELIHGAINAVFGPGQASYNANAISAAEQFEFLRRLVASRVGFDAFISLDGFRTRIGQRIVQALRHSSDGVKYAAIDLLAALMRPMHDLYDPAQEQLNKRALLKSEQFVGNLCRLLSTHSQLGTGALICAALLDFFTYAICQPYSLTTDADQFAMVLKMLSDLGRNLFRLFQHPSVTIVKGAGLLMRAMAEEAPREVLERLQHLALSEGSLLVHLYTALYTNSSERHTLTNREISRQLISLWTEGNAESVALLGHIFPKGLVAYLSSSDVPPADDHIELDTRDVRAGEREKRQSHVERFIEHWNNSSLFTQKKPKEAPRPVVYRKRATHARHEQNWDLLYYHFRQDHARPDLIWNEKTREELKEALEAEMRGLNVDKELGGLNLVISWNFVEFEVTYESLSEELCIGDNYVRLLLEQETGYGVLKPVDFFFELYHRFLLTQQQHMKLLCLQAMAIVYGRYGEEIGPFTDLPYIVQILRLTSSKVERDRLLIFLDKLLMLRENVKAFIEAKGIRLFVDLLTLAHFHIDRAQTPLQSNLLEAGDSKPQSEKEWYYNDASNNNAQTGPFGFDEFKELFRTGVINNDTRCWAPGMDGWRKLSTVAQLKWSLVDGKPGIMNETQVAVLVLDVFNRVCQMFPTREADGAVIRPLPKIKRILSESTCLPHLVNLFLTFDPTLVEKTATLLTNIMEDNPNMPKLFQTGAFLFSLMYTGSNLLPLVRFWEATHDKQAYRNDDEQLFLSHPDAARSVLSPILPVAMVCYLQNHGHEKFSKIFLGDFDTPEAIWSHEMRRLMIEKIAAHISEFTPRLMSNTYAIYSYHPIPTIPYPQLADELFCNIYYLRHLTNTAKFPNWPISRPVELLKDVLDAWKREVDKKPPVLTYDSALSVLGLTPEKTYLEADIRKAYFRMAAKYHPDKNPDGREIFESVNKAYEFLVSFSAKTADGPTPLNIETIIRAQSILFARYGPALSPYKYAGYPLLIKTMQMETADEKLFSRSLSLLPSAAELAFHTVNVSALNARELLREGGFDVASDAFIRCMDIIGLTTQENDIAAVTSTHLMRMFAVSSLFDDCCAAIVDRDNVVRNVALALRFVNIPRMRVAAIESCIYFARNASLQNALARHGAIWHLIPMLFKYDYTLAESGVETSIEHSFQQTANHCAVLALRALGRLGGYLTGIISLKREVTESVHTGVNVIEGATTASGELVAAGQTFASMPEDGSSEFASIHAYNMKGFAEMDLTSPSNLPIRAGLESLLTWYLSHQLSNESASEALKMLTSNAENPYLIWNNSTRVELLDYVQTQLDAMERGGGADPSHGANFHFRDLRDELYVGHIYVRIFNKDPTFIIEDPPAFMQALVGHLRLSAEVLFRAQQLQKAAAAGVSPPPTPAPATPGMAEETPEDLTRRAATAVGESRQILLALYHLLSLSTSQSTVIGQTSVPAIAEELLTVSRFKLLFFFLSIDSDNASTSADITLPDVPVPVVALRAIERTISSRACITAIAEAGVLHNALVLIAKMEVAFLPVLDLLHGLFSNSKLVEEALRKGGLLYLLHLICNSKNGQVRTSAAAVLGKMSSDKLHGPRVVLLVNRFLPPVFMETIRENPETAVLTFERDDENPELIWTADMRKYIQTSIRRQCRAFFNLQNGDLSGAVWQPPADDAPPLYEEAAMAAGGEGGLPEVCVGGVFLRLFIRQPNWGIRNPKHFLNALFERFFTEATEQAVAEPLALIGAAVALLIRSQPILAPYLAGLDYMKRVFAIMRSSTNIHVLEAAVIIANETCSHASCLEAMAGFPTVAPLLHVAAQSLDHVNLVADTLRLMFEVEFANNRGSFGQQALETRLVAVFLKLLQEPLAVQEGAAAIKAQIVRCLKALSNDPVHGATLQEQLNASEVWLNYRDQRHDLFLTQDSVRGLISGPASGNKGLLTGAVGGSPMSRATGGNITSASSSSSASTVGIAGRLTNTAHNLASTVPPASIDHYDDELI